MSALTFEQCTDRHRDIETLKECRKFFGFDPESIPGKSFVLWEARTLSTLELQECISDFQRLKELAERRIADLEAQLG